jgi:hypothetical protein
MGTDVEVVRKQDKSSLYRALSSVVDVGFRRVVRSAKLVKSAILDTHRVFRMKSVEHLFAIETRVPFIRASNRLMTVISHASVARQLLAHWSAVVSLLAEVRIFTISIRRIHVVKRLMVREVSADWVA